MSLNAINLWKSLNFSTSPWFIHEFLPDLDMANKAEVSSPDLAIPVFLNYTNHPSLHLRTILLNVTDLIWISSKAPNKNIVITQFKGKD